MTITQGRLKELLYYNPETGIFTNRMDRNRAKKGEVAGYSDPKGYMCIVIDRKHYPAYRLAWLYTYGHLPEGRIDHKNQIKNDNRLCNLREISLREETGLTQERLKELLNYDSATGIFTNKINRRGSEEGAELGNDDGQGYLQIKLEGEVILAHRLAWLFVHGYYPENDIDHKNRIRNDNRICNLREVSAQCNARNRVKKKINTSGVVGISFDKLRKLWVASIKIDNRSISRGGYTDFADAVLARYHAEVEYGWPECIKTSAYLYLKEHNLLPKEDTK